MLDFVISDTLSARLDAGAQAAVDYTPAMAAIADTMRTGILLNFESESSPDGQKWKPSQRAIEDGGLTLNASGELRLSITADSDATDAVAGTNKIYGGIHQFGGMINAKPGSALNTPFGPRGSVTLPAREFLGFGPDDIVQVERILLDHLDAALNGGAA